MAEANLKEPATPEAFIEAWQAGGAQECMNRFGMNRSAASGRASFYRKKLGIPLKTGYRSPRDKWAFTPARIADLRALAERLGGTTNGEASGGEA